MLFFTVLAKGGDSFYSVTTYLSIMRTSPSVIDCGILILLLATPKYHFGLCSRAGTINIKRPELKFVNQMAA